MRIKYLDGLRGLAIISVIIQHSFYRWPEYLSFVSYYKENYDFAFGQYGVKLFFIISGYVIFMSLTKLPPNVSFFGFLKLRYTRLLPGMFLATFFVFVFVFILKFDHVNTGLEIKDVIPGLILIHPKLLNLITGFEFNSLEGAFWTLYIEVAFYILVGFVYFFFGKDKCLFSIAFIYGSSCLFIYIYPHDEFYSILKASGLIYYVWFALGMYTYEPYKYKANKYILIFLFVSTLIYYTTRYADINNDMAVIITIFCVFKFKQLQVILESSFFVFFGGISYLLYLTHENVIIQMILLLSNSNISVGVSEYLLVPSISVALVLAYLLTKLEYKLINLLR